MVGYGTPGAGSGGTLSNFNEAPVRVKANNQFDTDIAPLDRFFSESGQWEATTKGIDAGLVGDLMMQAVEK
jgi:hypothetical protein